MTLEIIPPEKVKSLIEIVGKCAPGKKPELDELITRLKPKFILERNQKRILFQADKSRNAIKLGLECSYRLESQSYAYGLVFSALLVEKNIREPLNTLAYQFLNWSTGNELKVNLGMEISLEHIFPGSDSRLPHHLLKQLTENQRIIGFGIFCHASSYIILHELAHLHFANKNWQFENRILEEKGADRFAAEWLVEANPEPNRRLACLLGIATALIWLSINNIFFGPNDDESHPPGYERLFQVLDNIIDVHDEKEDYLIWGTVTQILISHINASGTDVDSLPEGTWRDTTNHLINIISKKKPS